MKSFFDSKSNLILVRVILLLILFIIHFLVLHFGYKIELNDSLIDSFIFNFNLFLIGFVIIYPIKYISLEKMKLNKFIINHIITAGMVSAIWVYVSYFFMIKFFKLNIEIQSFLQASLLWRLFIGVFFYFIFVSIFYLISFYDNLLSKTQKEKELILLVKDAELKALRYQINPHFLFNSFNSINYLIQSAPQKASEMLITLSDYFRNIFSNDENDFSTLQTEIENINRYLAIEKIRFEEKIKINYDIDNSAKEIKIPHMILQPLFENIIKHAVHDAISAIEINFQAKIIDGFLRIYLSNNFEDCNSSSKGAGIGLTNIEDRIVNIYGSRELFKYNKSNNIFFVSLKIPIENEKRI